MNITITNKIGILAKKHLEDYKTRFPSYSIRNDKVYNGIVIEIEDDDADDFYDALDAAGFDYETEEVENSSGIPKWPKYQPKFPKGAPKAPKARPVLGKVKPKLPRAFRF